MNEANTATTFSPLNKQTQPYNYDNVSLNDDDIVIEFPAAAVEGEIIAIVNNGMSTQTVKVEGNGNNVQALSAPYTTDPASIGGPKLSVTYQLRSIAGGPLEWRIF